MNIDISKPWKVRQILWLIIPAFKAKPRPYLIVEVKDSQATLVIMSTSLDKIKEEEGPTQYVIVYEKPTSRYQGSFVNYNTLIVVSYNDLTHLARETYREKRTDSPFYQLNEKDFQEFQRRQGIYFQDPQKEKYITKLIFILSFSDEEKLIPGYLK